MNLQPFPHGFKAVDKNGKDYLYFGMNDSRKSLLRFVPREGETMPRYQPVIYTYDDPRNYMGIHHGETPTHVKAIAHQFSANGVDDYLDVSRLEHIRSVNGGSQYRNSDINEKHGVDYSSHTYHFFLYDRFVGPKPEVAAQQTPGQREVVARMSSRRSVVFAVNHGGGIRFHIDDHFYADEVMMELVPIITDRQFFALFDLLVSSYDHGREHGTAVTTKTYVRAFLEGRLKKRKKNNAYTVEINDNPNFKPKIQLEPA